MVDWDLVLIAALAEEEEKSNQSRRSLALASQGKLSPSGASAPAAYRRMPKHPEAFLRLPIQQPQAYRSACVTTSSSERDEFPTINDIFKSLSEDPTEETITKPPDVMVRNIDINLETLNMSNFREKIEGYSKAFSTNTTDDSNVLVKEFSSRRLAWAGGWADWNRASKVLVYTKLYDLMLQTIYMARHKIKQIENDPYYNPTETSYRIAFLYRNLLRLNRRVMDAYTTMKRNRGKRWRLGRFLILHHRVAKLHMDFLYLWWVMVRLNERYEYRHGIPNTTPRPGQYYYPP